jgi:hypothetical protein
MILRKKNVKKFTRLLAEWFAELRVKHEMLNKCALRHDLDIDHILSKIKSLEDYLEIEYKETKEYRKKK